MKWSMIAGIVLPALLLAACEKIMEVPLPPAAGMPVLNALLHADSTVHARITFSGRVGLNEAFKEPVAAELQLFENGQYLETLKPHSTGGLKYYVSRHKVQPGHTYRVTANIAGYPLVAGTDPIPAVSDLAVSDQSQFAVKNSDNKEMPAIRFTLANHSSSPAWYRFQVFYQRKQKRYPLAFAQPGTNNILDENSAYYYYPGNSLPVGGAALYTFATDYGGPTQVDTLVLVVNTLTRASFQYLESVFNASENIDDPLSEKVQIVSNVTNGLGIVGGITTREYLFTKP